MAVTPLLNPPVMALIAIPSPASEPNFLNSPGNERLLIPPGSAATDVNCKVQQKLDPVWIILFNRKLQAVNQR